ncbi:hypothetical protein CIK84_17900 [Glutamicibacter arilaitensis]|uniref:Uncharacterized protein n=1 Tax=Glutamicibacter arilaitensis TaxID=256701 RepID=A0A2N7RXQ4_9MICC|nr:hypothetical protein CIK84_17900 [Glutamicibacter arilaitensis]
MSTAQSASNAPAFGKQMPLEVQRTMPPWRKLPQSSPGLAVSRSSGSWPTSSSQVFSRKVAR